MSKITQAIYESLPVGTTNVTAFKPVKVDVSSFLGYNTASIQVKIEASGTPPAKNSFLKLHYAFCQFDLDSSAPSSSSSSAPSSSSSSATSNVTDAPLAPVQLFRSAHSLIYLAPFDAYAVNHYNSGVMSPTADYLYCWVEANSLGADVTLSASIVSVNES